MNIKTMKTGQKLGLSASLIIGMLLILTSLSYMRLNHLAVDIDGIANDRYPKTVLAHTVKDELIEISRNMHSILLTTDAAAFKRGYASIEEGARIIGKSLETLNKTVNSAKGRELLHTTINAGNEFSLMTSSFLSLVREGKKETAQQLLQNQLRPVQTDLADGVEKFIQFQSGRMTAMAEETAKQIAVTRLLITIMIFSITASTVSVLLVYFFSRGVRHTLKDAVLPSRSAIDVDFKHMLTPVVRHNHSGQNGSGKIVYLDEYRKTKAAQTGQHVQANRLSTARVKPDE